MGSSTPRLLYAPKANSRSSIPCLAGYRQDLKLLAQEAQDLNGNRDKVTCTHAQIMWSLSPERFRCMAQTRIVG
jgi:hypothetical protein